MKKKGFTLIEVLLTVALSAAMLVMSIPLYNSYKIQNDLNSCELTLVQAIRNAQVYSQSMRNDSSWGIMIGSSTITLYSGQSYSARNQSLDVNYAIPTGIVKSGLSEVVFGKLNGNTSTTGTITLKLNDQTRNIVINSKGITSF